MVGKKRIREDSNLRRTDNDMAFTSWPQTTMINQKNYYTEYLKRDDQILALRLQNDESRNRMAKEARDRDRAFAQSAQNPGSAPDPEDEMDETMTGEDGGTGETYGSKIIVIHVGSQNMRVGLASDVLPKTVPMVVARKSDVNEYENDETEPIPKRQKLEGSSLADYDQLFGDEFSTGFQGMAADLTVRLRRRGHRVVPQSRSQAVAFNRKNPPSSISEHNDLNRIEWTDLPPDPKDAPNYITGQAALRIPDFSTPRYKLYWPIRYGAINEKDYLDRNQVFRDISLIIEDALNEQLGIKSKEEWPQYDCVFVIPDLYNRGYVAQILETLLRDFAFNKVCFIQESLAGSFGAGYGACVIVDVGAQKTSICCVDEGMCVENSRVYLKYGGMDVTETFIRTLLFDGFQYSDIDLRRRYDFLLAEELKKKLCTLSFDELKITQDEFYLRAPDQETRYYQFRTYDAIRMAPITYFNPEFFNNEGKLDGRRKLMPRSIDLYDGMPNDPISSAQNEILGKELEAIAPSEENDALKAEPEPMKLKTASPAPVQYNKKSPNLQKDKDKDKGTPQPDASNRDDRETPDQGKTSTPALAEKDEVPEIPPAELALAKAEKQDQVLPMMSLSDAIILSIVHGAKGDEKKMRDFLGGIIPIGGGAQVAGFNQFLEQELSEAHARFRKELIVGVPPREIDPQVLIWKGASVFGKLRRANDSWIGQLEFDRLGARVLAYKCLWNW